MPRSPVRRQGKDIYPFFVFALQLSESEDPHTENDGRWSRANFDGMCEAFLQQYNVHRQDEGKKPLSIMYEISSVMQNTEKLRMMVVTGFLYDSTPNYDMLSVNFHDRDFRDFVDYLRKMLAGYAVVYIESEDSQDRTKVIELDR